MLTHAAQVSVLCKERGALLLEVWQAHATLLRTVHAKMQVSSDVAAWTTSAGAHCILVWERMYDTCRSKRAQMPLREFVVRAQTRNTS